jgi:CheY-like chemotaxis protein/anti-sigma regulatory factor (Ser/Thr protein kinase)
VETSRPSIDASGHELDILLPPEPLVVNGDAVRLTQVLANLLNNAAKYTDPGGRISLEVARDGEVAVMTVRDTGIGIAPGMLGRVFDLFVQTDPHDGRSQGGLGLGLALVRRLVEMHGGTVHAASEGPGRGSEFMVRMPLAAAGDEDPVEERPPGMSPDVAAQRVLIVDDNRDAAQSLGMLLKLLGVEVHVTFSGLEAIEALPLYRPDVVLLDLGMPVMDGVEVARRIRQHPDFHGVTLIALTGWGQATDRDRVREAGFDYHLIKPADIAALTAVLENAPRNGRQPASRMAAGELSPPETEGTRAARPATGDARDTD